MIKMIMAVAMLLSGVEVVVDDFTDEGFMTFELSKEEVQRALEVMDYKEDK